MSEKFIGSINETKCNKADIPEYEISSEAKELFQVNLDLLEKFKSICEKYSITYYASSGTLIGAVRHEGFIPWDDDMDLFLMWDDYKKFLEVAPKECGYPYFFQSHLTEDEGEASASRLRRSDTTGYTQWENNNITDDNYNKGIFIDIFPLFYVPDTKIMRYIQKKRVTFWWKCMRGSDANRQKNKGLSVNKDYEKYEKLYKLVKPFVSDRGIKIKYLNSCGMAKKPKKEVGITSYRCHAPKLMWNAEWFEKTVELKFENTTISCPLDYDKILRKQYGDYMTPVMNGSSHQMVIVDTKKSYKEYFESGKQD